MDQTTHETLAKACGISRGLVQHYFPDRDELILVTLRYVRAKFQKLCVDAIELEETAAAQLRAYIVTACSWAKLSPPDAKVWLLFYYHCGINRQYRKLNTELVGLGQARIEALLQELSQSKGKVADASVEIRAKLIQNAITSFYVSSLTENQTATFNDQLLKANLELCFKIAGLMEKVIRN